jgi:hypothetical protein
VRIRLTSSLQPGTPCANPSTETFMKKIALVLASLAISAAAFNVHAEKMNPKTRADVMAELKAAIKSGDLIEPFTHKTFKELYPAKYPMSDTDADMMANEMMKNMDNMKK